MHSLLDHLKDKSSNTLLFSELNEDFNKLQEIKSEYNNRLKNCILSKETSNYGFSLSFSPRIYDGFGLILDEYLFYHKNKLHNLNVEYFEHIDIIESLKLSGIEENASYYTLVEEKFFHYVENIIDDENNSLDDIVSYVVNSLRSEQNLTLDINDVKQYCFYLLNNKGLDYINIVRVPNNFIDGLNVFLKRQNNSYLNILNSEFNFSHFDDYDAINMLLPNSSVIKKNKNVYNFLGFSFGSGLKDDEILFLHEKINGQSNSEFYQYFQILLVKNFIQSFLNDLYFVDCGYFNVEQFEIKINYDFSNDGLSNLSISINGLKNYTHIKNKIKKGLKKILFSKEYLFFCYGLHLINLNNIFEELNNTLNGDKYFKSKNIKIFENLYEFNSLIDELSNDLSLINLNNNLVKKINRDFKFIEKSFNKNVSECSFFELKAILLYFHIKYKIIKIKAVSLDFKDNDLEINFDEPDVRINKEKMVNIIDVFYKIESLFHFIVFSEEGYIEDNLIDYYAYNLAYSNDAKILCNEDSLKLSDFLILFNNDNIIDNMKRILSSVNSMFLDFFDPYEEEHYDNLNENLNQERKYNIYSSDDFVSGNILEFFDVSSETKH